MSKILQASRIGFGGEAVTYGRQFQIQRQTARALFQLDFPGDLFEGYGATPIGQQARKGRRSASELLLWKEGDTGRNPSFGQRRFGKGGSGFHGCYEEYERKKEKNPAKESLEPGERRIVGTAETVLIESS